MIKRLSLGAKMLYTLLIALLCSVLVYFSIVYISGYLLHNMYMSPESISARKAEIYSDFSRYVVTNNIKGSDSAAVTRWSDTHDYVTILVYSSSSNAHGESGRNEQEQFSNVQIIGKEQHNELSGKLYPMRFSDGLYYISISDNSHVREELINKITAISLGSIAFVIIVLAYMRRLTMRIIRLSSEAIAIGSGDLEKEITVSGEDELSVLALEMDNMRRSVIERMGNEAKAWQSNTELITAISHDIRTPMTSVIGYLGLLNASDFSDVQRCKQFSSSAYDKAMELKDLTDELFKYFLVFGKSQPELNMESLDGRLLSEQFLGETQFELQEQGFNVKVIEFEGECTLNVDTMYLKRVIDNIISNIKKYADRDRPIIMLTELKDGKLSVCVSNYTKKDIAHVESTKIGLRTCEKIMSHMGGNFVTRSDSEHFTTEFSLPAHPLL